MLLTCGVMYVVSYIHYLEEALPVFPEPTWHDVVVDVIDQLRT